MKSRSPILLILMTVIVAVPLLGTFFPLESYLSAPTLSNPLGTPVTPTMATMLVLTTLYLIFGLLVLQQPGPAIQTFTRNWFLLAFAVWAIVTAIWAESPALSFNRSGRLLISVLYGMYIAQAFEQRDLFRILFWSLFAGTVLSVLVTVAAPGLSWVIDARGAIRGAYAHKNVLGGVASLALIISIFCYLANLAPRGLALLNVLLSFALLVLSNSITALLAFVFCSSIVVYLRLFGGSSPRDRFSAFVIGGTLAAGAYLLFSANPTLFNFIQRDFSTLTGRTDIWRFANSMIEMKPILGWGHGAWDNEVFQKFTLVELNWTAPAAHNTWLDFRLQLGIPGLILGIICAIMAVRRVWRAILTSWNNEYLVWLAVLLSQGVRSGTETLFVDPSSVEIFWASLAIVRLAKINAFSAHLARRQQSSPSPQTSMRSSWARDGGQHLA